VKPKEIFEKFRGSDADRTELIEYNIQDCELCNKLTWKLDILTNNIGMANVCHVPLTYLFLRGQGVKIFSLVSKKCRKENYLIPVIKKINKTNMTPEEQAKYKEEKARSHKFEISTERKHVDTQAFDPDEDDTGFEGALVIPPIAGVYLSPIIVLDYASLYPSAMIYRNLSHECLVKDTKYMNLPDYKYITITYNNPDGNPAPPCIFARKVVKVENADKTTTIKECSGILPQILQELLNARKAVRALQATEKDPFKYKVLEGLQLAFKITANSLYGQTGAPTSPIYMKEIAACTTATGREMLHFSQEFVETIYDKIVNYAVDDKDKFMKFMEETYGKKGAHRFIKAFKDSTSKADFFEKVYNEVIELIKGYHVSPKIIYGDTDSVFFDLRMRDDITRRLLQDKSALEKSIRMGQLASVLICTLLDPPMRQEYEKCLWPFMILSKKRYVGNLYMDNPNKYFQKCMGIVLKRRDNANIVKIVCGGIIDHILNKHDPAGAIEFTKKTLSDIMKGKFNLDKFVITKTLRSDYKNRESISHAVLADRMRERDPGNAPVSNDRIPYVFIVPKGPVKLQGERIEHVDYVVQNNLKIDYLYYITNQIMKPALQFLELVAKNPKVIFDKVITIEQNCRLGVKPVTTYYE
jgi:DNA polymerase elongation subunit (family B)